MASEDWYRNEKWDEEVEEDFFVKLKRSRSQKTQYLKIQAAICRKLSKSSAKPN